MGILEEYEKLKRETLQKQRECDRAQGALRQLLSQLEQEHACKTAKEAVRSKEQMEKQLEAQEELLREEMQRVTDKYEKFLKGS